MIQMVLTGIEQLEIREWNPMEAEVSTDEILVDVLCCAICRTDAKMWEQGHRDLVFPRVLGHEMVVRGPEGNPAIVWPGKSCGRCRHCRSLQENLCERMEITGFHRDGGFAHQVVLPKQSLIPLPLEMDLHAACFAEPVGCVIHAFDKLLPKPGQRMLIYGAGTMGLVTALYARSLGLVPLILEKHETKIRQVTPFLTPLGILCVKETLEGNFDLVITACPDSIALCQAVTKVDKGGGLCFFSGITKNEQVETNLLNLIHYKEVRLTGAYGMKRSDMERAIPFLKSHEKELKQLIEKVVLPQEAPGLLPRVLTGQYLKFILDFTDSTPQGKKTTPQSSRTTSPSPAAPKNFHQDLPENSLSREIIQAILPLSQDLLPQARTKMDDKAKPLGALGKLEELAIRMSRIQNSLFPVVRQKNLFVFAGDHGITEEGVSAFPSKVTGQMVENFLGGGAAINVLCRHYAIDMKVVDMGVIKEFSPHPDLIIAKVACGTRNFARQAAMTRSQMIQALESGMKVFLSTHSDSPLQMVGLGEMGIGNTTSAAAIISTITGLSPSQATGRGTGVDDPGLIHKTKVIKQALAFHKPDPGNGFEILEKIGGFEIAGMAGCALAAAAKGCAVVLDGVISTAAGLIAYLIAPSIQGYLVSGHKSVEPAQTAALDHMGLCPVIDYTLGLGEGTGAAMAMDTLVSACKLMTQMASFDQAKIARSSIKQALPPNQNRINA